MHLRSWLGVVVLLFACGGCARTPHDVLARASSTLGLVERDFAAKPEAFEAARPGAEFRVGDAIRTNESARATLKLSDGSELSLESSTLVRFLEQPPGQTGQRLEVAMGSATLETSSDALSLQMQVGRARIEANTRIHLRAGPQGTRFEVLVGGAELDTQSGPVLLSAGKSQELDAQGKPLARTTVSSAVVPATQRDEPAPAIETGAELTAVVSGSGESSARADGATEYVPLVKGTNTLSAGSTLRLGSKTSATLRRGNREAVLEGAGEYVVGGSDWLVRAASGGVSIKPQNDGVQILVQGGSITIEPHSGSRITARRGAAQISVQQGRVVVTSGAEKRALDAGEEATVDAQQHIGVTRGHGPAQTDLQIAAGESIVVHDPRPPTAVAIVVGDACPGAATVELSSSAGTSSIGQGTVSVLVPAGSHRYRIDCVAAEGAPRGAAVLKGTISVLHDGGTRQLARTAPPTLVDTDGRNYTVLYQSLMPELTVRWPSAPVSGGYQLHVRSSTNPARIIPSARATYTFAPGSLPEGVYQVAFSADNGSQASRDTTLSLHFDNAAPTASITSPAEGGFSAGAEVHVSGTSLPGWAVSAGGAEMSQDDQHRFSGTVVAPSDHALMIRFANPERGVHLYLRRPAAARP